jgi:predicted Zn-dependent protease
VEESRSHPSLLAAGAFETAATEVAVATSAGQFAYGPSTQARVNTVVSSSEGGTGTAEQLAARIGDIDAARAGRVAAAKAASSERPRDLPAGRYDVVLEPMAVDTMVVFLSYIGFNGRAIVEGRSPFSGRQGQQVAAPDVDIYDDALSPLSLGLPFDFEGTPKRRLPIIERGVFVTGVHDRRSARQAGVEPTGHALPAPNPEGAFALNLFLEPGQATMEQMIAGTERGLLVTRFHYTNVVNPMETTITGMTRDGTWLIEGGEVAYPVKNLRFTQSILEALSNVEALGDQAELAGEFFFAASRVPAAKIRGFTFSGTSDH